MFKFIKQYAEKIEHIEIYPMISLLIFFLFFVVLLIYVRKLDKSKIKIIATMPLEDTDKQNNDQI